MGRNKVVASCPKAAHVVERERGIARSSVHCEAGQKSHGWHSNLNVKTERAAVAGGKGFNTFVYEESLVVSESSEDRIQGLMGCVNEMRSTVCDMQEDEYWQHDNVGVS